MSNKSTPFPFVSESARQGILKRYDDLLTQWPVLLERHYVGANNRTHVLAWGNVDGPPLVLIHGSTSNSVTWMGDAEAYGKDHHVFALDIPGDCGYSMPERPELTGEAYAAWVLQTLDAIPALAERPIRLLGISLGGWVSLEFASRHPARVAKLGLLCPAGIGPQRKSLLLRILWHSLFGEKGTRRLLREISGDKQNMPEEAIEFSLLLAKSFRPIMDPIPLLSDEALRKLTMPVKVLVGGRDVMIDSRQTLERLSALVPHAACLLLPDAPHALINKAGDMMPFFIEDGG